MIKEAGADGTKVTVYGNNDDPTDKVTEAYADHAQQDGLQGHAEDPRRRRLLPDDRQRQKTAPQTGFANWFQDFPHPKNFFFLVDGKSIQPTNNQNFGNVDDPEITKGIARAQQGARADRRGRRQVGATSTRSWSSGPGSPRTATASWRRSCQSGWTSTTARRLPPGLLQRLLELLPQVGR